MNPGNEEGRPRKTGPDAETWTPSGTLSGGPPDREEVAQRPKRTPAGHQPHGRTSPRAAPSDSSAHVIERYEGSVRTPAEADFCPQCGTTWQPVAGVPRCPRCKGIDPRIRLQLAESEGSVTLPDLAVLILDPLRDSHRELLEWLVDIGAAP